MSSQDQKLLESPERTRNVVLTGFGIFRDHVLNPSWEAIKDDRLVIDRANINIIKQRVDVAYEEVDKVVGSIWKTYDPLLVIHIGLAAHVDDVILEQRARHGPYIHDDTRKQAPHKDLRQYSSDHGEWSWEEQALCHNYTCKPCNFECNYSCFDMSKICVKLNYLSDINKLALRYKTGDDAGLYICEYIYHKSLGICDRTVFLHVPSMDNFMLKDITEAVKLSIEVLIDEALNLENQVQT